MSPKASRIGINPRRGIDVKGQKGIKRLNLKNARPKFRSRPLKS